MKMRSAISAIFIVLATWSTSALAADTVQIRTKEGIGPYLADGAGMTLYYVTKDQGMKGAGCAGPCLEKWPIFLMKTTAALPAGLEARDFGVITRPDGKKQSTFRGWPMYTFVEDKAPGDTQGQGKKDVWHVITTNVQ